MSDNKANRIKNLAENLLGLSMVDARNNLTGLLPTGGNIVSLLGGKYNYKNSQNSNIISAPLPVSSSSYNISTVSPYDASNPPTRYNTPTPSNTTTNSFGLPSFSTNNVADQQSMLPKDFSGGSSSKYLRYNSSPDFYGGGSTGNTLIGADKNFDSDGDIESELEQAVYDGISKFELNNSTKVNVKKVIVNLQSNNNGVDPQPTDDQVSDSNQDVFYVGVPIDFTDVYKAQELIDYITNEIELIGTGTIEVLAKFDYDSLSPDLKNVPVLSFQVIVDR